MHFFSYDCRVVVAIIVIFIILQFTYTSVHFTLPIIIALLLGGGGGGASTNYWLTQFSSVTICAATTSVAVIVLERCLRELLSTWLVAFFNFLFCFVHFSLLSSRALLMTSTADVVVVIVIILYRVGIAAECRALSFYLTMVLVFFSCNCPFH